MGKKSKKRRRAVKNDKALVQPVSGLEKPPVVQNQEVEKEPDCDVVSLIVGPIVPPPLLIDNVFCPYTSIPFGMEMHIRHARKNVPEEPNEFGFTAVHVAADHSGCGWWRLHEVEDATNYNRRGFIMNTSVLFPVEFFIAWNFDAVRIQRQVGYNRVNYWRSVKDAIRETCKKTRLIYEIDDIVCDNKIPEFNTARDAFATEETQKSIHQMLDLVDEFTVVSKEMRRIYHKWHPAVPISVIPNFATRGWFDGFYDHDRRMKEFDRNRKRPRILVSGGATHTDQRSLERYCGDYAHVMDAITSARKDFCFVFMGVLPNCFRPFIESGEMEYAPWVNMMNYPSRLNELNIQATIAPLANVEFNVAKSNIHFTEACYMGFSFVGQRMEPYEDAFHVFDTGPELIDILKSVTKDDDAYSEDIEKHRDEASKYWMDDKIDDIIQIYKTPYGDESRKKFDWFVKLNPEQF